MSRVTVSGVALIALFGISRSVAAEEPHETWLRVCVGEWKASSTAGPNVQVVGRPLIGGKAVLFEAVSADGTKGTGLLGWEPDTKRLVETGYGTAGDYYQLIYTEVTPLQVKGRCTERSADGSKSEGDWTVTRTGDDLLEWQFVGTKDGKPHTYTGKHVRVK